MVPIERQIACITRELQMRHRVYPRLVEARRMTQADMETEIATMQAVVSTLRAVQLAQSTQQELFAAKE